MEDKTKEIRKSKRKDIREQILNSVNEEPDTRDK